MAAFQRPKITRVSYDNATENLQIVYSTPDKEYEIELNSRGSIFVSRKVEGKTVRTAIEAKTSKRTLDALERLDDLNIFFCPHGDSLAVSLLNIGTEAGYHSGADLLVR